MCYQFLDFVLLVEGQVGLYSISVDYMVYSVHPRKTNMSPEKDYFSREYIFQPVIFRGHVSFRGCTSCLLMNYVSNHWPIPMPVTGMASPAKRHKMIT